MYTYVDTHMQELQWEIREPLVELFSPFTLVMRLAAHMFTIGAISLDLARTFSARSASR